MKVNDQVYLQQHVSIMSQSGNIAVNIESKKATLGKNFRNQIYSFKWDRQSCPASYKHSDWHKMLSQ